MDWNRLKLVGYKAYLVGVLMIVLGLLQGDDKLALEGLSVIALRAGIAKGEVR